MILVLTDFLYISNMKKILLFFLLATQFLIGQNQEQIKKEFTAYIQATNSLNASQTHALTYPAIFEKVTVQMLQDMYKNLSQNPNFNILTNSTNTPIKINEVVESGGRKFVKIIAENQVLMTFKSPVNDPNVMASDFKVSMNAKKVNFDPKSNTFNIIHDITVIGIQDSSTQNTWKFINFSPRKNVIAELFGKEVSKLLKL